MSIQIVRVGLIATLAGCAALTGCSSENEPAVSNANDSGTDGNSSNGASSDSGGSAASSTSGSDGTGGGPTSSSDSSSTSNTTGGTTLGDPSCDVTRTSAGAEIKKGVACTDQDPQLCWRTCGPGSVGWKSETCVAGSYAEGDCQFPVDGDYSCYAIPDAIDAEVCPSDVPQATEACDVPECTLCNLGGEYLDSGGSVKMGYCVCNPPNADGARSWTCASDTAWPCPLGNGC
jgi:hypothetical protein